MLCNFLRKLTILLMTTQHTDEKKPARGGLVEAEFWAQMESLAANARRGDAAAALALSQRVLRMSGLVLQSANNADGAFNHQLPKPGLQPCPHGDGRFCHCAGLGGYNPEWFK